MLLFQFQIDLQPIRDTNIYMYLYFVYFIVYGCFIFLNLFIGLIIVKFDDRKEKAGGSLRLCITEDQQEYFDALKNIGWDKPTTKPISRPKVSMD